MNTDDECLHRSSSVISRITAHGWAVEDVASYTGIDVGTIRRWWPGTVIPTVASIQKLEEVADDLDRLAQNGGPDRTIMVGTRWRSVRNGHVYRVITSSARLNLPRGAARYDGARAVGYCRMTENPDSDPPFEVRPVWYFLMRFEPLT